MFVFGVAPLSRQTLATLPARDTLVLTVNNRLARQMVADLAQALTPAQPVTELPRIVPLAGWLHDAADDLAFVAGAELAAQRLDDFAAQQVWMAVIAACEADHPLLDVSLAAQLAVDADRQIDEWALDVPAHAATPEYQRFCVWRAAYRKRLRELDATDANLETETVLSALARDALNKSSGQASVADRDGMQGVNRSNGRSHCEDLQRRRPPESAALAARALVQSIPKGQVPVPAHVVLAGFADVSPRLQRLIAGLQGRGAQCHALVETETAHPTTPLRWQASDHDAEWQAASDWAGAQLRTNPAGRYAIVAASLHADAPLARRVLTKALRDDTGAPLAFNVAVGRALADWPAVRAALAWLRVLAAFDGNEPCPAPLLGQALLAGHCAGEQTDTHAHATLDVAWRRRQVTVLDHDAWCRALQACPHLAAAWARAREVWSNCGSDRAAKTNTRAMTAEHWSHTFRAALAALGFPGERALDSVAWQVCTALDALLSRYAGLARVSGPMRAHAAVALLAQLAQQTPFQPGRDPAARLDVLGLLEAEGGRWDGVWALGLSDEVLPASPKPNPLIPLAVLRGAGAPRATPERERQWADERYAALCACAPTVIVSHPAIEGERSLRPAPLIAELPLHAPSPPTPLPPAGEGGNTAAPELPSPACGRGVGGEGRVIKLEELHDTTGLPLSAHTATPGGLDVLETQARNPLWAYVRHRLGARALADYADTVTASARGRFLHAALETLAALLPDQASLHAMAADTRAALIGEAVAHAADATLADWPQALRDLESARAHGVLADWLALEARRAPYAIAAVEQTRHWQHGPLALTLRLDRIDRLADGRIAVIDYKTGAKLPNPLTDWTRTRPVNVQLPFYAAVLGGAGSDTDATAALILAQLHARSVAVAGFADGDIGLTGLADASDADTTWQELLTRWQRAITQLADEFTAGIAHNTTLRRDDLQYCDALAFLRLEDGAA